MPRKATKLPTGVQRHGKGYRIWYLFEGDRIWEPAGTDLRKAESLRRQRVREIAEGAYVPGRLKGRPTVASYYEVWIAARRKEGVARSVDDEARWIELHALPVLGDKRLDDLRPVDVRSWVMGLRGDGHLAAKSIHNAHGALSTMLEAARFEEIIGSNPAHRLPRGTLPPVSKRKRPPFARAEAEALLADERVELERRVLYALLCLAGLRLGEACGRRWRDIDADARPLHCMTVATQYDDQPLKTAKGDADARRQVPVHPELARLLADWKLRGFAAAFGRHPRPEDFIVPDPRTMGPRTKNQALKALYRDCDAIGLGRQGTHAGRRFFVSHARMDGAWPDVLERVTHNAAGEQIDEYTYFGWSTLCEAVACLRVDLRRGAVVSLPAAACATGCATREERPRISERNGGGAGSRTNGPTGKPREIARNSALAPSGEGPVKHSDSVPVLHDVPRGSLVARAVELLRTAGHREEAEAVEAMVLHLGCRG